MRASKPHALGKWADGQEAVVDIPLSGVDQKVGYAWGDH